LRCGGRREKTAVADIVPGDIALNEADDRVPADLRLLRTRALLIDDAVLTGEPVASEKDETRVVADVVPGLTSGHIEAVWRKTELVSGGVC
jgi:P-type E1-E2 ATPase